MSDSSLTMVQKKEWARLLYVKENVTTYLALAKRVGVQARTISRWVKDGDWEKLRKNIVLTRSEQLSHLLTQLEEFNEYISRKPEGLRFADSREADARRKLIADIKALETDASIAETINVCTAITSWLSKFDLERSKAVSDLFDDYIKSLLQ